MPSGQVTVSGTGHVTVSGTGAVTVQSGESGSAPAPAPAPESSTPTVTAVQSASGGGESLLEMTFSGSVPDTSSVFYIVDAASPYHDDIRYYRVPVGAAAVKSGDATTLVLNIQDASTLLQIHNNGEFVDNFGSATEYSSSHDPKYFDPASLSITTTDPTVLTATLSGTSLSTTYDDVVATKHQSFTDLYIFSVVDGGWLKMVGIIVNADRTNYLRIDARYSSNTSADTSSISTIMTEWSNSNKSSSTSFDAYYLSQTEYAISNVQWSTQDSAMSTQLSTACTLDVDFTGNAVSSTYSDVQAYEHTSESGLFIFAIYDGGYLKMVGATAEGGRQQSRARQMSSSPLTGSTPAQSVSDAWDLADPTGIGSSNFTVRNGAYSIVRARYELYTISNLSDPCA